MRTAVHPVNKNFAESGVQMSNDKKHMGWGAILISFTVLIFQCANVYQIMVYTFNT